MILLVFAIVHSGLASFRDIGEKFIGERAFRVLFAGISLPLAVSAVVCTIKNAYLFILFVQKFKLFLKHMCIQKQTHRLIFFVAFFFCNSTEVASQVYFIDHRYDGVQLWQVQGITGMHEFVWFTSFISFFFLYPSTFNLLEVAAVDKPKMHMYETGIMRITRHPQASKANHKLSYFKC